MTVRISTPSLGMVGPYLLLGSLVLSPVPQTVATAPSAVEMSFVKVQRVYASSEDDKFEVDYNVDLNRFDLVPSVIARSWYTEPGDSYEPFIISEGWREEPTLEGPFLVEEDRPRPITFDDYDRAAIGLYE